MSDGTPNPATWPMCLGPDAYGHATAARIFWAGIADHHTSVLRPARSAAATASTRGGEREQAGDQPGESGRQQAAALAAALDLLHGRWVDRAQRGLGAARDRRARAADGGTDSLGGAGRGR